MSGFATVIAFGSAILTAFRALFPNRGLVIAVTGNAGSTNLNVRRQAIAEKTGTDQHFL